MLLGGTPARTLIRIAGPGADAFFYPGGAAAGSIVIADFAPGEDAMLLSAALFATPEAVLAAIAKVGDDAVLTVAGQSAILLGVDAAILEAVALGERRQAAALLVLLVAALLVELEEAVEEHDGTRRAQAVEFAIAAFDFDLPPERIAQEPPGRRGTSRLLRLDRSTGAIAHHTFADLPDLLAPGDLLVVNDTRVFPARLIGRRLPGGGAAECFLVKPAPEPDTWVALVHPGQRLRPGARMNFDRDGHRLEAEVISEHFGGRLNTAVAVFRTKQDHVPVATGTLQPDGSPAFRGERGTVTEGFELSVSGEVLTGWQLMAGYAYGTPRKADGTPLSPHLATRTVNLATSYRLPGALSRLTVGGNLSYQNATSMDIVSKTPLTQGGYTLIGLLARYELTPRMTVSLNVENVTDKTYTVELTGGQQPVNFWVSTAAPHRLMKLTVVGAPIEMIRAK